MVLLKTFQELHTQVEISQLTLDFYGRLQYNHQAWMHLYKVVTFGGFKLDNEIHTFIMPLNGLIAFTVQGVIKGQLEFRVFADLIFNPLSQSSKGYWCTLNLHDSPLQMYGTIKVDVSETEDLFINGLASFSLIKWLKIKDVTIRHA